MKRKLFVAISILLLTISGCNNNLERDTACQINASRSFNVNGYEVIHSLFIEKNESRFVWSLECQNESSNSFYFEFSFGDVSLCNSEEFEYITSTNDIVEFNDSYDDTKNGFDFTGPITIYIYYNNASKEIKDIIDSNTYNIVITSLKWFSKPELFE